MGPGLARAVAAAKSSARGARNKVVGAARGYLRTGGYYGRFTKPTGTELKFFEVNKTFTAAPSAGVILSDSLHKIADGTGQSERLGRKLTVAQVHINGTIVQQGATNNGQNTAKIRIMVVLDKQCNGATATVTGTGGPLETADVNSFRNLENSSRFKVLADKTMMMVQTGAAENAGVGYLFGESKRGFKINLPRLNIPVEFSGTTGALTEIRSNNIFVMALSDENTNTPQIQYIARIRFRDN